MNILLLHPIKIAFNTSKNLARLTLAIALSKPFFWHSTAFQVVTAIAASLPAMAQGDNIQARRTRAAWILHRNPVIHSNHMPQARRPTADSAAAIEIDKRVLPIGCNKIAGNMPPPPLQAHFWAMCFVISSPNLFVFFWLALAPAIEAGISTHLAFSPASVFPLLFMVVLIKRFDRATFRALLHSVWNIRSKIWFMPMSEGVAAPAISVQSAGCMAVFAKILGCVGLPFLTAATAFEEHRQIQHSAPSYADLPDVDGQAGEVPAFPIAIGRPSFNIIPQVNHA